jgi:hypothetical protein
VLDIQPLEREPGREGAHGRGAELGGRALGDEREHARELENGQRVRVHRSVDANNPNKRSVRPFGL